MSCRVDNGESCSMETVCASNCSPKKQQQKNPAMNNLKEGEDVLKIDAKMESNSKEALDKVEPTNDDDSSLLVPSTSSFNPNAACTVPAAHTGDSFSSSSSLNKGSDDVDLHAQWPKNSGEKHECEILPERSGVLQAVSTCSTNKKVKGKDEHKSDKKLLAVAAANALSIVDDQADSTIGERTGVDETCNESSAGGAASDQSESLGDANAEKNGDKCSKQVYGSKIQSPSISKCAKNRDLNVKEMPYTKEAGIEALEVGQNGTQDILVSLMEQETTPAPKPKRSKRRRATSPITPPMPDSNGSYTILTPIATENAGGHRSWHSSARSTRSAISSAVEPTATVLFTGVEVSDKHKKMVRSIGASLIESIDDAASATHVIAGDTKNSLRRTPKLMVALCVTPNILHLNWLNESFKAGEVLKCNKYLLLKDKAAEKKYNFSMKTTIKNGSEAREKGGIFADMYVYFCKGVAGNKAPSIKELEIMVSSAGGTFLKVLPKNNVDTKMILIITSDPATEAQKREKLVMKIIEGGGHLVSTAWLFQCMIAQEFMAFPVDSDNMNSLPRENVRKKKRTIDGDISEDGDRSHTRRKTRRR
uniref:BRCT domain-containing protein n=1 Tax=Leptocylindrus danicus TaxID=163516 RepID=A0A7S2LQ78_9STRA